MKILTSLVNPVSFFKNLRLYPALVLLIVVVLSLPDIAQASPVSEISKVFNARSGKKTAVLGGRLKVEISHPEIAYPKGYNFKDIVLYISDQPFEGLLRHVDSSKIDNGILTLSFNLLITDDNRKQWQELFNENFLSFYLKSARVSVAKEAGSSTLPAKSGAIRINLLHPGVLTGICIFLALLLGAVIYLSYKKDLIRDDVELKDMSGAALSEGRRPYSLSRTQFAWWTIVIVGSFIYLWAVSVDIPNLNGEALILLGISIATNTGAKLIDDKQGNKLQHQAHPSEGFLTDILSDGMGISIHRFQMAVWTLVFGIIYIIMVVRTHDFPTFGTIPLTLMGLSSATYLALKGTENQKAIELNTAATTASSQTDSEEASG